MSTLRKLIRLPYDRVNDHWNFLKRVLFNENIGLLSDKQLQFGTFLVPEASLEFDSATNEFIVSLLNSNILKIEDTTSGDNFKIDPTGSITFPKGEQILNTTDGTLTFKDSGGQLFNLVLDAVSTVKLDAPASVLSLNPTGANASFFGETVGNPSLFISGQGVSVLQWLEIEVGAVTADNHVRYKSRAGGAGKHFFINDNGEIRLDGAKVEFESALSRILTFDMDLSTAVRITPSTSALKINAHVELEAGEFIKNPDGTIRFEDSGGNILNFEMDGTGIIDIDTDEVLRIQPSGSNAAFFGATTTGNPLLFVSGQGSSMITWFTMSAGADGVNNDIDFIARSGHGGDFVFNLDAGHVVKTGSDDTYFRCTPLDADPDGVVTADEGAMAYYPKAGPTFTFVLQVDAPNGDNWKEVVLA